jgi:hypothetical protein
MHLKKFGPAMMASVMFIAAQGQASLFDATVAGDGSGAPEATDIRGNSPADYSFLVADESGDFHPDYQIEGTIRRPTVFLSKSETVRNSAVPEPASIIAGALLLLPFGAGIFRRLRRDKSA